MPWTPTENTIDTSRIEANILAFIAASQSDALLWANNGTALKAFNFLAESLADPDAPKFPSLAVTGDEDAIDFDGDVLETGYRIGFESVIFGDDAATLPARTKIYGKALKSMLANITPEQLADGTSRYLIARAGSVSSSYGALQTNEQETAFFQVLTVTATYRLIGSSY